MNNVMALNKTALKLRNNGRNFAVDEAMPHCGKQKTWIDTSTDRTALGGAGKSPVSRFESTNFSNVLLEIFAISQKITYNILNFLNKKPLERFILKEVEEMGL